MTLQCKCFCAGGSSYTLTDCLRFSLVRERYLPYGELNLTLPAAEIPALPVRVQFSLSGQLLHDGYVRNAQFVHEKGERCLKLRSRSYTAVLLGNQLVPGMHYNITLQSLMTTYALPHITYQDEGAVNYIFVKENSSMWNALTAYSYKVSRSYPYIRVPNQLCIVPQSGTDVILLPDTALLSESSGSSAADLISRIEMANLEGEYGSFSADNPEALLREITKVKQISFDRQFIFNPADALNFRIACSHRRLRQKAVQYLGYCGEDIEDLVSCGELTARVGKVTVSCDRNGLVTEDVFYYDDFCNITPAAE